MNQRFSYSVSQLKSVNQQISESTNQWFNNSEIGLLTAHGPTGTWAREQSTGTRAHGHTSNPRAHGHTETHGDTAKSRAHGQSTGTRAIHEQSTGTRAHWHGPTANHPRARTTRQPHGHATRRNVEQTPRSTTTGKELIMLL